MIDIHAHVLPGVDDGAVDENMTAEMMQCAADVGIRAIVCTPHVYRPEDHIRNRKAIPKAKPLPMPRALFQRNFFI